MEEVTENTGLTPKIKNGLAIIFCGVVIMILLLVYYTLNGQMLNIDTLLPFQIAMGIATIGAAIISETKLQKLIIGGLLVVQVAMLFF